MVEFSLGDEVLVHVEDGLIYLGVLVEVEKELQVSGSSPAHGGVTVTYYG